jgi:hypothetical protein
MALPPIKYKFDRTYFVVTTSRQAAPTHVLDTVVRPIKKEDDGSRR